MGNYGIKVTTDGSDVGTADPRTISMSSEYTMFKIHSDGTQVGTIPAGKTAGTVNFSHNLGYVPAFWTYYVDTTGKQRLLSNLPEGIGYTGNIASYSGTDNITCIYDMGEDPFIKGPLYWTDAYEDFLSQNYMFVGKLSDGLTINCGVVFGSVAIPKNTTIGTAKIFFYVSSTGTNTADGTVKFFGIAADNTTSISNLSDPETTAGGTETKAYIPLHEYFDLNVTSIVQELVNRSGWQSGNGMGFHILDAGFPNGKSFIDSVGSSYLQVYLPGTNTFTFRTVTFKDKIN